MPNHVFDLITALFIYALLFCAYYGWGRFTSKQFKFSIDSIHKLFVFVWLGWAISLLILQTIHIFFPINIWSTILVLGTGLLLSFRDFRYSLRITDRFRAIQIFSYAVIILCIACWIASRSMLPPTNYDSGTYHFSSIQWINTYHLIKGLGNLNVPLAHNMTFFVYVASLNFFPYFPHGHALANSFLFLLLFSEAIWKCLIFGKYLKSRNVQEIHPVLYVPYFSIIPVMVYIALTSQNFSSPSPDLASTLLQIHIFVVFAYIIYKHHTSQRPVDQVIYIVILSVTAVTLKLSNIAFAIAMIAACLFYSAHSGSNRSLLLRGITRPVLLIFFMLAIWIFRGYSLSGYPLFPSTFAGIPVDWAVPAELVRESANDTYGQSRMPGVHWRHVLDNWQWLDPWFRIMLREPVKFVFPIKSSLIAIASYLVIVSLIRKKQNTPSFLQSLTLLFPIIAGIAFWFFTAPHIRFIHALLWLLSVCSSLVLLSHLHSILERRLLPVAVLVVLILMNIHFIRYSISHLYRLKNISTNGFTTIESVPLIQKKTLSGFTLYMPEKGEQCWNAPVPCSGHLNPYLKLRKVGDLSSGFTVEPL